jgi:hypothetical protein
VLLVPVITPPVIVQDMNVLGDQLPLIVYWYEVPGTTHVGPVIEICEYPASTKL